MPMNRREFLRNSAFASLLPLTLRQLAFADAGTDPMILVVVHLRGGCDGFNLISPASDPIFMAARSADLRVSADGENAGIRLERGPDSSIDFRLHSAATGLAELYQHEQLAFIHAAGLTNETRSHFVATDMIERGVASESLFAQTSSGWLARYLEQSHTLSNTVAVSIANTSSGEFASFNDALALPSLDFGFSIPGGAQMENLLNKLYATAPDATGAWGRRTLSAIQGIDRRLPKDAQGKLRPYIPETGVNYDSGADLGRGLKAVAQLIKMDIGLTAASVELGGWDTHENQPGRFKTLVERLSGALTAFWNDTARYHDRLLVVTVTEFGRRLRSNRSNGTDHGRAGAMAILGGKVAGGRFYGGWPGLAQGQLDEGVDLAVATDYRRVLTELLTAHSGQTITKNVFPGYDYTGAAGLLRS